MLNQFWHKSSFKLNQFWHWLYQTWLTCYSIDPTKYGPKHSFKIRSAGRPGARAGSGWRKNSGRKNPMWPGDLVKNHGCNPLTFVLFFTKTMLFWFKKKRIDPGDPMTQSKPGARALDRAGYRARSKNYGPKVVESTLMIFLNKKDNILNKNDRLEFTWQPKTLAFF